MVRKTKKEYDKTYRDKHKQKRSEASKVYRTLEVKERLSAKAKQDRLNLKLEAFNAYGGRVCACCREDSVVFLTIDHINNDGNVHRKEIGGGSLIYRWLKQQNYPEGFQVLCRNCNWAKQFGVCPHQESVISTTI
jgi:hypothetical protein